MRPAAPQMRYLGDCEGPVSSIYDGLDLKAEVWNQAPEM